MIPEVVYQGSRVKGLNSLNKILNFKVETAKAKSDLYHRISRSVAEWGGNRCFLKNKKSSWVFTKQSSPQLTVRPHSKETDSLLPTLFAEDWILKWVCYRLTEKEAKHLVEKFTWSQSYWNPSPASLTQSRDRKLSLPPPGSQFRSLFWEIQSSRGKN